MSNVWGCGLGYGRYGDDVAIVWNVLGCDLTYEICVHSDVAVFCDMASVMM